MKPAGALILAAGMSRRMGSFKPLMEFQGETLIGRVVRSLREAGASPIFVVVGCRAGDIRAHLAGERHLLCSEGGYDMPFTTPRAMMRNSYIHQMGEQTVVVQAALGKGGTWHGAVENLRRRWSPLYVFDDGSNAAQALVQQGAVPIRDVMALDHDA